MSKYVKFLRLFWVLVLGGFFLIGSCPPDCSDNDKTPPVITIKGDNPIEIIQGETYVDPGATATDDSDGRVDVIVRGVYDLNGTVVGKNLDSISSLSVGSYSIKYYAQDSSNNSSTKTREIKIVPSGSIPSNTTSSNSTLPTITIIGDNPIEVTQGETFTDLGARALDKEGNKIEVVTLGSVDTSKSGVYLIRYVATDKGGNSATSTRTVIVKSDNTKLWNVSTVSQFREALEGASVNGKDDIIILEKGVYKTTSDDLGTFEFNDDEEHSLDIIANGGLTYKDVILDGDKSNRVISFKNSSYGNVVSLKNISIVNGKITEALEHGAGIYSDDYINLILEDCNISNNRATTDYNFGGGIYARSFTIIINSKISNNRATTGGGIYISSYSIVINSLFLNNSANTGSALYCALSQPSIINNTFINNKVTDNRYSSIFHSASIDGTKGVLLINNIFNLDDAGV